MTSREYKYLNSRKKPVVKIVEPNLKDAAIAVADWWAEKMQRPLNQDNGAHNEPGGGMMFAFMNLASTNAQKTISPEKIEIFKSHIVSKIVARQPYMLSVDYDADDILQDACDAAGINSGSLPCKSHTSIQRDTFITRAKCGYGKPLDIIYPLEQ